MIFRCGRLGWDGKSDSPYGVPSDDVCYTRLAVGGIAVVGWGALDVFRSAARLEQPDGPANSPSVHNVGARFVLRQLLGAETEHARTH